MGRNVEHLFIRDDTTKHRQDGSIWSGLVWLDAHKPNSPMRTRSSQEQPPTETSTFALPLTSIACSTTRSAYPSQNKYRR